MNYKNSRASGIVFTVMAVIFIAVGVILALLVGIDTAEGVTIGGAFVVGGLLLLALGIHAISYAREEEVKNRLKDMTRVAGKDDAPMRPADFSCKYRVFVGITWDELGLRICYRRVGNVNELIVNDMVYDEKRGIIEHAHNLSAVVNGHRIDAGFDGIGNSYLLVDGVLVASKTRLI